MTDDALDLTEAAQVVPEEEVEAQEVTEAKEQVEPEPKDEVLKQTVAEYVSDVRAEK